MRRPVFGAMVVVALLFGGGPAGATPDGDVREGEGLSAPITVVIPAVKPVPPATRPAIRRSATAETVAVVRSGRAMDCDLAEDGSGEAAYRLARRYLFGIGVERNQRVGVAWLRQAAAQGQPSAQKLVRYVPRQVGLHRPSCRPASGGRGVSAPPAEVLAVVNRLAPGFGLDPQLVLAVIQVESAFRSDAVSPKDAAGLMQLIPATAERFAVSDVFDPEQNIRGGMRYLRWLLAYFQGDVTLAVAAYNAGEGAVDRFGGIPPYPETRNYVASIRRLYDADQHPFDPAATAPSPVVARVETAPARRDPG